MSTVYVIVNVDKVSKLLLCERISGRSGGTLLMAMVRSAGLSIYISTGLRRPREHNVVWLSLLVREDNTGYLTYSSLGKAPSRL